ncbi:MAG: hypothetical protein R2828_02780 [Saprospiraceae bacterium]
MENNYPQIISKLHLEDSFLMDSKLPKDLFLERLNASVDVGQGHQMFEAFQSKLNDYIGEVNANGFRLRRRQKMFESNMRMAIIEGIFKEKREGLSIQVKVFLHPLRMKLIFGLFIFAYVIFFLAFLFIDMGPEKNFVLWFIPAHGLLLFGIFYFVFRRMVKVSKRKIVNMLELIGAEEVVSKNNLFLK